MDVADTAFCVLTTRVMMWRDLWLQLSGFPREVQNTIEDLLFDEQKLFNEKSDEFLYSLKDSWVMLQSLGMYT